MTSHKHLKDAVRARMARTGERYTTAHRHLTGARRPPAPPDVVPGYPRVRRRAPPRQRPAHPRAGRGRRRRPPTTASRSTSRWSPAWPAGIGFMYFSFSYAGELPTMTIVPRIHPRPFLAGALERGRHRPSGERDDQRRQGGPGAGRRPRRRPHPDLHRRPRGPAHHDVGRQHARRRRPTTWPSSDGAGDVAADRRRVPGARRRSRRRVRRRPRRPPQEPAPDARRGAGRRPGRPRARDPGGACAVTVHDLTEDVMPGNFAGNFGLRGLAKWADAVADRRGPKGWARLFDSGPAFGARDAAAARLPDPRLLLPRRDAAAVRRLPDLGRRADRRPGAAARRPRATPAPGSCGPRSPTTALGRRHGALPGAGRAPLRAAARRGADAAEELAALTREVAALTAGLEISEATGWPGSTRSPSWPPASSPWRRTAAPRWGRRQPRPRSLAPVPLLGAADPLPRRPERVLVAGTSGAGKTTLARAVAEVLDCSYVELDSLHHGPGWTKRPEFEDDVHRVVAGARLGERVAVRRHAGRPAGPGGPAGLARPAPPAGHGPGRPPDPAPPAAAGGALERQRRAAAADVPDRPGPHRAVGLAHPRQDRRAGSRRRAPPGRSWSWSG